MNSEIKEKKNFQKYNIISVINKDEEIVVGTKSIKTRKIIIC